jgi:S-adenosylmethionine decarboxylase
LLPDHHVRLVRPVAPPSRKELHLVDAHVADADGLTDAARVRAVARAAVAAGGGHVLDESLVRFPNGAITLVLVLAESHLSLHTWPEELLVAIDLFSCGSIDGARVIDVLRSGLGLRDAAVQRIGRGG